MKNLNLFALTLVSSFALAQKATLIDDNQYKSSKTIISSELNEDSDSVQRFKEKKSLKEVFQGEYTSTYDMRSKRRVGIGVLGAGQLGLLGAFAELNFAMDDSAVVGFGWGPKFSAIAMEWKHIFGGQILSPYMTLGYARWYGSGQSGALSETSPRFLSEKYLNNEEKISGKFGKNFVIPSFGLQYNMLSGPYVGASVFAEVMLVYDFNNLDQVPTGSFGMMYYF